MNIFDKIKAKRKIWDIERKHNIYVNHGTIAMVHGLVIDEFDWLLRAYCPGCATPMSSRHVPFHLAIPAIENDIKHGAQAAQAAGAGGAECAMITAKNMLKILYALQGYTEAKYYSGHSLTSKKHKLGLFKRCKSNLIIVVGMAVFSLSIASIMYLQNDPAPIRLIGAFSIISFIGWIAWHMLELMKRLYCKARGYEYRHSTW